jgi:hypothetical protein
LALYPEIAQRRLSDAGWTPYGFVGGIRDPDRAELSGPQQFDQSDSVATVGTPVGGPSCKPVDIRTDLIKRLLGTRL